MQTEETLLCPGTELHHFMKAHWTAAGVNGKNFIAARHDNQDWQLRFFRMSSFDDSVEFTLFRVEGSESQRRILSLYFNGTYSTNIHPANKDPLDEMMVRDILNAVTTHNDA